MWKSPRQMKDQNTKKIGKTLVLNNENSLNGVVEKNKTSFVHCFLCLHWKFIPTNTERYGPIKTRVEIACKSSIDWKKYIIKLKRSEVNDVLHMKHIATESLQWRIK